MKVIKLFFLLVLNNVLLGQNKVINSENYVLYVGLDNRINIDTNNGVKHDFIVELYQISQFSLNDDLKTLPKYENASIIINQPNCYNIRINRENGNLLMVVKNKVEGKYIEYSRQFYFVKYVPHPVLYFGNAMNLDSTINLFELKKLRNLSVELPNFTRTDLNYKVVSYKFRAVSKNAGGSRIVSVNSSSLESIHSILDKLDPGDFIQFYDIKIIGPADEKMLRDNFSAIIANSKR